MQTIVFLPGLGCDSRLFFHQINALKIQFNITIIVCDTCNNMRGHVEYVLRKSPEKFILIGHSFGGWVAQWVAIYAPDRITKLVLLGTGTGRLTPGLRGIFEKMLQSFIMQAAMKFFDDLRSLTVHPDRAEDAELINLIEAMQMNFKNTDLINQVKTDLEGQDTTANLKNIKCETLLIHGKQDAFYAQEMQILRKSIPKNDYTEIDQCGHMIPIERPAAVTALIESWLGRDDQKSLSQLT